MGRVPGMLVTLTIVILVALAGPGVVHAQPATPGPDLPAVPAPLGLGTVRLPADAAGVAALFERLPANVSGEPRAQDPNTQSDRVITAYGTADPDFGPPLVLQAMNLATGDFFPRDFTAADYVAAAADPASDSDAGGFGQDSARVWVQATTIVAVGSNGSGTPTTSRVLHTFAWGDAASPWLFTAAAFSPEGLDALVSAFVAAAEHRSATPTTGTVPLWHRRADAH